MGWVISTSQYKVYNLTSVRVFRAHLTVFHSEVRAFQDWRFTASALDSAICIRNSRWTSSVRTSIQGHRFCGVWVAQHSAHDVWGVDVPSLPSTVSFSAERTSVVVNVTLARAGVGANQGYDTLSEIVSLGPTQFLYSKFHGLLKLIFHTNQYNGA